MTILKLHAKRYIQENQNVWSCFTLKEAFHLVSYRILQIPVAMGFLF